MNTKQAMQAPNIAAVLVAACLALFSGTSLAATAAKVVVAKGEVSAQASGASRALQRRSEVMEKEAVTTGADSRTQLRFVDGALLTLNDDAELYIDEYSYKAGGKPDKVLMKLVRGGFRTVTGAIGKTNKAAYQVDTPLASIGIRGTMYSVLYNAAAELLEVIVLQGSVVVFNQFGSIEIRGGGQGQQGKGGQGQQHNAVRVRKDQAPEPYTVETDGGSPAPQETFEGPGEPDDSGQGDTNATGDNGGSSFGSIIEGNIGSI